MRVVLGRALQKAAEAAAHKGLPWPRPVETHSTFVSLLELISILRIYLSIYLSIFSHTYTHIQTYYTTFEYPQAYGRGGCRPVLVRRPSCSSLVRALATATSENTHRPRPLVLRATYSRATATTNATLTCSDPSSPVGGLFFVEFAESIFETSCLQVI